MPERPPDGTVTPLEIKRFIIRSLDLEDVEPEDLPDGASIFEGGLGLDSVDALELAVALERTYGAKVVEAGLLKVDLGTPAALAAWITALHRQLAP
jgi:acyl carrier protein